MSYQLQSFFSLLLLWFLLILANVNLKTNFFFLNIGNESFRKMSVTAKVKKFRSPEILSIVHYIIPTRFWLKGISMQFLNIFLIYSSDIKNFQSFLQKLTDTHLQKNHLQKTHIQKLCLLSTFLIGFWKRKIFLINLSTDMSKVELLTRIAQVSGK